VPAPPFGEGGNHVVDDRPMSLGCIRGHLTLLGLSRGDCSRGTGGALRQINGALGRRQGGIAQGDRVETPANSYITGFKALCALRLWTHGMLTVIIVIHLMIVSAMIGLVLLQKSEGGGLGMGGGGGGFLTSRGTSNVLTRTTAILAAVFFATSLLLSILAGWDRKPRSILQDNSGGPTAPTSQPAAPGGNAPLAPGGVLDRLRQGTPAGAPSAPAEPQAPQSR
jgi:preprotein translocase subunit SecG